MRKLILALAGTTMIASGAQAANVVETASERRFKGDLHLRLYRFLFGQGGDDFSFQRQ